MKLILHPCEKQPCRFCLGIIVNTGGIDVGDLLVKPPFRKTNLTDAFQLFLKIILCQNGAAVFQPLVIHSKAFHGKFFNDAVCPLSELHRTGRIHLIAHGNDGAQIIMIGVVGFAVRSSYSKFSNN